MKNIINLDEIQKIANIQRDNQLHHSIEKERKKISAQVGTVDKWKEKYLPMYAG